MDIFGTIGDAVGNVGGLVKCVTSIVDEVVGQLGQHQSMLEDQARAPIQSMLDEVSGGAWTGSGANAFMEECNNTFLPTTQQVSDSIGGLMGGITAAVDVLEQADTKAAGLANDLTTEFEKIYKS